MSLARENPRRENFSSIEKTHERELWGMVGLYIKEKAPKYLVYDNMWLEIKIGSK